MKNFPLPLLFVSVDAQNPVEVAQFLRDFADTLETLHEQGETVVQYARGPKTGKCGGEVKIKWSRNMEDDKQFVLFRRGKMRGYGDHVEICGTKWYEEEVETES